MANYRIRAFVRYWQRGRITDEHLACLAAILAPSTATTFEGQRVRLAVKTHLLHFFDPSSGAPLR